MPHIRRKKYFLKEKSPPEKSGRRSRGFRFTIKVRKIFRTFFSLSPICNTFVTRTVLKYLHKLNFIPIYHNISQ